MMVVDDLREPLAILDPRHVLRLGLRDHVEVTVVVVAGVFLVRHGETPHRAFRRIALAHVRVRDHVHAVRVGVHGQDDHVVEDAHRLGVRAAHELIHGLEELLRAQCFRGVEPAIEPHDGFAGGRQLTRVGLGEPFRQGQATGDVLEAGEPAVVFRGRDDRHEL